MRQYLIKIQAPDDVVGSGDRLLKLCFSDERRRSEQVVIKVRPSCAIRMSFDFNEANLETV